MKTKIIPVWHVEYSFRGKPGLWITKGYGEAEFRRVELMRQGCLYIAITGPHQHRVPA